MTELAGCRLSKWSQNEDENKLIVLVIVVTMPQTRILYYHPAVYGWLEAVSIFAVRSDANFCIVLKFLANKVFQQNVDLRKI